jgi:hypothetical protein
MLRMLAGRYLDLLTEHGEAVAKEWEARVLKNDQNLIKQLIPVVHEMQRGNVK